jgi:hypothetical protein
VVGTIRRLIWEKGARLSLLEEMHVLATCLPRGVVPSACPNVPIFIFPVALAFSCHLLSHRLSHHQLEEMGTGAPDAHGNELYRCP